MDLSKHWAATLDDYVIDLGWSADGTMLAAASGSGPVSVFSTVTGETRATLEGHDNGTNVIAWHPSQPLLASGGQDGAVKMWDAAAGQHVVTTSLGTSWIEHLAWRNAGKTTEDGGRRTEDRGRRTEDGEQRTEDGGPKTEDGGERSGVLLAAAAGRELHFLRADGAVVHTTKPAPKTIAALAWQPAGGCVAAATFGSVCLWDADDFVLQKEFPYANGIHALTWSPDSRWLVSGNQDPSVHLWLPDEDQEFHMSGYEGKVKELSFDQTGRWLATGGGRDCCVWDCSGRGPEGREPAMLPHDDRVCAVAFQQTHSLLATASMDGVVQLWSVDRRQPLRATVRMPAPASKLAWSPDDRYLAVGSEQGIVYVLRT